MHKAGGETKTGVSHGCHQTISRISHFEGEKYVSLGYKYQLIDQDYPLLALNEVLVNVEYRPDGSSLNMYRQYIRNPRGFAFIRKSSMQLAPTSQRRFIEAMHYVADSLLARNPHFLSESPRKWLTLSALLPGITWYGYIRYKARNYHDQYHCTGL